MCESRLSPSPLGMYILYVYIYKYFIYIFFLCVCVCFLFPYLFWKFGQEKNCNSKLRQTMKQASMGEIQRKRCETSKRECLKVWKSLRCEDILFWFVMCVCTVLHLLTGAHSGSVWLRNLIHCSLSLGTQPDQPELESFSLACPFAWLGELTTAYNFNILGAYNLNLMYR